MDTELSKEGVASSRSRLEDESDTVEENEEECYDSEDLVSESWYSPESTFTDDPLLLEYSYGYDCRTQNLCVVDPHTLLWQTGNIIHIFDAVRRKLRFRRSALGQDISCIVKSRARAELAVGENGGGEESARAPMIVVYEWPDFKVRAVLKGGAVRCYKCLDFSPDGSKLVSQAGPPDETLTIWDVEGRVAVMSLRNPEGDVTSVQFSPYDPDLFLTGGRGHVKFWRLVDTFTGLKLEATPGRFGDIETNDISTAFFLPDGRTITNLCDQNLAIWRPNGFLELDLSMKDGESCHSQLVTFLHVYFQYSHVYTAGLDGKVRVWNFLYITSFYNDEQQESVHVEIEPSYERAISSTGATGAPILMLPKGDRPYHFYCQDVNGGVWLLDLELKKNPDPWEKLYSCHSGPVNDMAPSPADYYLATLGEDGKFNVYSHKDNYLVVSEKFTEPGTSIIWLPLTIDPTGTTMVVGFLSGVLRVVATMVKFTTKIGTEKRISVVQTLRPHSASITSLTIHRALLISGSADKSVFLYHFTKGPLVSPIGMILMPGAVCHVTCNQFLPDKRIVLVTCDNGQAVEIDLTNLDKVAQSEETLILDVPLTVTSAKLRSNGEKLFFSKYLTEDLIWIEERTTEHRYHNYVYRVGGGAEGKMSLTEGRAAQCYLDLDKGRITVLGLSNGRLKVVKTKHVVKVDKTLRFYDSWETVMHNTSNCLIKKLCLSYDGKVLYSCGSDSAIFAYKVNLVLDHKVPKRSLDYDIPLPKGINDVVPKLSLEEEKIHTRTEGERKKHQHNVEKYKSKMLSFLTNYTKLLEINKSLPKTLRIPKTFFRLQTDEERAIEKAKRTAEDEQILAPLRQRQQKLFKRVSTIQEHFVDPIKTPKYYLFAIREPHYLKSFPERRLYSKDDSPDDGWSELLTGQPPQNQPTEFERMVTKILSKRVKEREIERYYEQYKVEHGDGAPTRREPPEEELPDLISAAGDFLNDHNKFTLAEKLLFRRINQNRLKRLRCQKELKRIASLQTDWQTDRDQIDKWFQKLLKSEIKSKDKYPPVTEKLYDLLNIRQLIYMNKESFNKSLRLLREEKSQIIDYCYWAQEEINYMKEDMERWGLELDESCSPPQLEVVWDLEYPDMLRYAPGPTPNTIADRMTLYEQETDKIKEMAPIEELRADPDLRNHRLFPLVQYRQERFNNSLVVIRETIDRMIRKFDSQFLPLLLQRTKVSVDVNDLKSEYASLLQEVDISYRYELLQKSASRYQYQIIKIKHAHILRVNVRKKKIEGYKEQTAECSRTVEDLNAKFMEMIKEEKWAKHLARTYKRKFKSAKSAEDDNNDSEESSSDDDDLGDEDDDLDEDDDEDPTGEKIAYLYDETVIPPGCDEEKFRQTFRFRSQRHVEENKMSEIRRQKEGTMAEMKSIGRVVKVCDALLALFYSGTFRFQQMMKEEMDDIEYLVKLRPSQVQIFADGEVPPLSECRLVEQDDYASKVNTLREMKQAIQNIEDSMGTTQRNTKLQAKELRNLMAANTAMEANVEKLLVQKYGKKLEVDEVQTYALTDLIRQALKRCNDDLALKREAATERAKQNAAGAQKADLLKTKKDRLKTLHTLYTIEAEKNRIAAEQIANRSRGPSKKLDLTKERDELKKSLQVVESAEAELRAAIENV